MVVIKTKRLIKEAALTFGVLGSMALSLAGLQAQGASHNFKKDTLKETEIEILYSHYIQEGDNSAVTGGTGTEELTVYAPAVKLKRKNIKGQEWSLKIGADVITSASTDNINFVMSSASLHDTRAYFDVGYAQAVPSNKDLTVSVGTGLSVESDYLSIPFRMGLTFDGKNKMRTYSFDAQYFFDDLRWGRFDEDYKRPAILVYPRELRNTEWHDQYLRQSFNFKFGFTQIVNQKLVVGVFPGFMYQTGLLSTPFHRIYFSDDSKAVENLPSQRSKFLLGLKANAFLGGRFILKNAIDLYQDDFSIRGLALNQETAIKLNEKWTLSPFVRLYFQEGSKYFAPFQAHDPDAVYYTSDYDLSDFSSFKSGLSIRFAPYHIRKRLAYNDFKLRYAYYKRSDGLQAHIFSLVISLNAKSRSSK